MTTLEKVAKAIAEAGECGSGSEWCWSEQRTCGCYAGARAAIEALREPSEGMLEAGETAWMCRDLDDPLSAPIRDSFQAMIDHILNEEAS